MLKNESQIVKYSVIPFLTRGSRRSSKIVLILTATATQATPCVIWINTTLEQELRSPRDWRYHLLITAEFLVLLIKHQHKESSENMHFQSSRIFWGPLPRQLRRPLRNNPGRRIAPKFPQDLDSRKGGEDSSAPHTFALKIRVNPSVQTSYSHTRHLRSTSATHIAPKLPLGCLIQIGLPTYEECVLCHRLRD